MPANKSKNQSRLCCPPAQSAAWWAAIDGCQASRVSPAVSAAFPLPHVFSNTHPQLWSYFSSQGCGCQPLGSSPRQSVNAASHHGVGPSLAYVAVSFLVRQVLCHYGRDMAETHVDTVTTSLRKTLNSRRLQNCARGRLSRSYQRSGRGGPRRSRAIDHDIPDRK